MNELYLALKALDSETFQRLIFQLLKARYPDVLIQQIDGRGGDQGLDIISGQLAEQPTVWECKSFPDGVKKSQQEQITKSLKRTLENFTPKRWVLCLSVDMRTETCKWFQILVKSHAADTAIELYGASEIIGHLIHFDSIREHFFPNTVLNTRAILEQLAGTNEFTDDELGKLNEANVKSYVERLQSRDHRFTYQITFGRDRPPTPEVPIGSLLNIAQDGTAINVFPRDIEALRVCPPQITLMPKGAGVEKFLDNCRSGRPQTFTAEELFIKSDLDFLLPREGHWEEFSVGPTASTKTNPFRITFGKGESAVLYEYVQFREVRRGTEERLFESVTGFPLQMFLLIRPSGTCDFRFEKPAITQPVTHFMKLGRALSAMNRDGSIEFYDLESSESFSGSIVPGSVPAFHCFAKTSVRHCEWPVSHFRCRPSRCRSRTLMPLIST